jgi:hypothetical protein
MIPIQVAVAVAVLLPAIREAKEGNLDWKVPEAPGIEANPP